MAGGGLDLCVAEELADHRQVGQGLAGAQYRLGLHYQEGRGVVRNPARAAAWYRRAADQCVSGKMAEGEGRVTVR